MQPMNLVPLLCRHGRIKITVLTDVSRKNKDIVNKIMLKKVSNPFSSFLSAFTTNSLNVFSMFKDNETVILLDVVNGNPVFTGNFHADFFAIMEEPFQ